MRLNSAVTLGILMIASIAFGQKAKWVQPTKDNVGIYKNQIREVYEQPISTVGTKDRLQVVEVGKNHYKVKYGGQTGWVESQAVAVSAKGSKSYIFEDTEVIGYLDNPTPVYIIDTDDKERDPIKLDRSFAEALRENVDKETVERQVK